MEENTINLRIKAEELFNREKFEEIKALLTNEVLETHKDSALYAWRARAHYRSDYNVSVTMLFAEKAIESDPNYFMGYFARGCAWDDKKEYDKAIMDYTKAIEINPYFADAYCNRGLAWQNKKDKNKAIADYDKAIENYTKAIVTNANDAEIYVWRGNTLYYKEDYKNAAADYSKAININPEYAAAYFYRGLAWVAYKKYPKAIADYTRVIYLEPDYKAYYYINRGLAWKAYGKNKEAIDDYTEAIKISPDLENAYYNRGLAKKEKNIDLEGSKKDFEKYLELAMDVNEIWTKYAKDYITELDVIIKDSVLRYIKELVENIEEKLRIKEKCITHYTSLSVLKSLILDNSKFRISEGNFMNDPSEGKEFFDYLKPYTCPSAKNFSPKPFIGSFVGKDMHGRDMHNDLNMWRFYGKEKGVEAKGCSIILNMQKFIGKIEDFLSNEKNTDARMDDEYKIKFYQVVYVERNESSTKFYIPNSDNHEELQKLMKELKGKVNKYNGVNKIYLEKYLNSIAFLFKSDCYKNENEVRLVVKGIEFEKKYNMDISSPRVYIDLVSVKDLISKITLGPKVDKEKEWRSAFHYSYGEKIPKIVTSQLPYK